MSRKAGFHDPDLAQQRSVTVQDAEAGRERQLYLAAISEIENDVVRCSLDPDLSSLELEIPRDDFRGYFFRSDVEGGLPIYAVGPQPMAINVEVHDIVVVSFKRSKGVAITDIVSTLEMYEKALKGQTPSQPPPLGSYSECVGGLLYIG